MDDPTTGLPGIGDVARLVGLDADTLRFYERRGVLPAPARDGGGRRRYTPADIEAIRRLLALKSTGMSLADIARFANVTGRDLARAQLDALERHAADLRAQRRRLDAGIAFLEHKLDRAHGAAGDRTRYLTRGEVDIAYSVTGSGPWLFLVGAPAGRTGFAALARALSDRFTVVTHDPRGVGDSGPATALTPTPQVLADDLAALVMALTPGPAAFFGTSGGAVTVLELLARAPRLVARAVVHEPPLVTLLGDVHLAARCAEVFSLATRDPQTAFERWLDLTGAGQSTGPGELPAVSGALPPLSPAELDKNRYFLGRMAGPTVFYEPDIDALVEHPPVVCAGERSHGQLARLTSEALAARLGAPLAEMPYNHLAASTHPDEVAAFLVEALCG